MLLHEGLFQMYPTRVIMSLNGSYLLSLIITITIPSNIIGVLAAFFSLPNQTYYFLTNLYRCVKVRNNQNKNPANQHFIGTCAKQSPRARIIQSQVTKQQNFEARNVAFVKQTYHFIGCNYQFFI